MTTCLITTVVRYLWDRRVHAWFWATLVVIVLVHVFLIFWIPSPLPKAPVYFVLWAVGFPYFYVLKGTFLLVERIMSRGGHGN
jgi:hypothetical protein